jgi:hypothetical protein
MSSRSAVSSHMLTNLPAHDIREPYLGCPEQSHVLVQAAHRVEERFAFTNHSYINTCSALVITSLRDHAVSALLLPRDSSNNHQRIHTTQQPVPPHQRIHTTQQPVPPHQRIHTTQQPVPPHQKAAGYATSQGGACGYLPHPKAHRNLWPKATCETPVGFNQKQVQRNMHMCHG